MNVLNAKEKENLQKENCNLNDLFILKVVRNQQGMAHMLHNISRQVKIIFIPMKVYEEEKRNVLPNSA